MIFGKKVKFNSTFSFGRVTSWETALHTPRARSGGLILLSTMRLCVLPFRIPVKVVKIFLEPVAAW